MLEMSVVIFHGRHTTQSPIRKKISEYKCKTLTVTRRWYAGGWFTGQLDGGRTTRSPGARAFPPCPESSAGKAGAPRWPMASTLTHYLRPGLGAGAQLIEPPEEGARRGLRSDLVVNHPTRPPIDPPKPWCCGTVELKLLELAKLQPFQSRDLALRLRI